MTFLQADPVFAIVVQTAQTARDFGLEAAKAAVDRIQDDGERSIARAALVAFLKGQDYQIELTAKIVDRAFHKTGDALPVMTVEQAAEEVRRDDFRTLTGGAF